MFFWEICEIFKNTYFEVHLETTASVSCKLNIRYIGFGQVNVLWSRNSVFPTCSEIYVNNLVGINQLTGSAKMIFFIWEQNFLALITHEKVKLWLKLEYMMQYIFLPILNLV